jgi:hypothetical protein
MINKYLLTFLSVFLPLLVGSIGTYYLKNDLTPVVASCLATLVFIVLNRLVYRTNKNDALIFCGSFISMGNIGNEYELVLATFISTLAFIYLKDKLQGYGGKLGTIAFIGCFASLITELF